MRLAAVLNIIVRVVVVIINLRGGGVLEKK